MVQIDELVTGIGRWLRNAVKKFSGASAIQKLTLSFIILYLVSLAAGAGVIYYTQIDRTKSSLHQMAERVQEDIQYQNGQWDISQYNADTVIPGRFRLYVFSADGFVVERWRPIAGFLDTSDFKNLLSYQSPKTINTITDQHWRMFSKPITDSNNNTIGVITTSYFNPDESKSNDIDTKLQAAAAVIEENIATDGGHIEIDQVDPRFVQFDVAFQVVDQYNRILVKSNNVSSVDKIPNFIDPSYVRREIDSSAYKKIKSRDTDEVFLAESQPLLDQNTPYGVVVVASTITNTYSLVKIFILTGIAAGILLTLIYWQITRHLAKDWLPAKTPVLTRDEIKSISFSKKDCAIKVNERQAAVAYATNQYYMCVALTTSPTKKWEIDELLERFGEAPDAGWRKVYDAMTSINKKVAVIMDEKLIVNTSKTYQINPELVKKLK